MNVQRFTGRTSREAMQKMRAALGDDAVVLSTKPCVEGIEMLAMAPGALAQVEEHAASRFPAAFATTQQPQAEPAPARAAPGRTPIAGALRQAAAALAQRAQPTPKAATRTEVQGDAAQLSMSTLSFQDYVRERMLKKRDATLRAEGEGTRAEPALATQRAAATHAAATAQRAATRDAGASRFGDLHDAHAGRFADAGDSRFAAASESRFADAGASRYAGDTLGEPIPPRRAAAQAQPQRITPPPMLREEVAALAEPLPGAAPLREAQADAQMLSELRSMKGLIEERFGALAFMEKLQRQPAQARLTQKLLEAGFSPILIRKLVVGLTPEIADETGWAASILERNLQTGERELPIEDQGGVFALVGATGVGKTTSTAKLAAAFATRHGASNLGLITLDAYRLGAHEQLRAYGRILGVPVHTAHDRTTLEDLLDLLSGKKMVLIDTAGLAQRDARTKELLDMLAHRTISRLLVVSAAAQGETIDDVMTAYRADTCRGIVLSKLDEAVKLAPALDAVIRHRQKIVAVANGQRVPEDWHRLSGQALVHRALRATASPAYHFDASEMNLVFAAPQMQARRMTQANGTAANAARA
ncbi:MAG TPA: flagellar biosynthesis protein FlhF [Methylibium sp.]|uniref:flagellar biosynthesis protein FlhF n=1 Tax=Methylibium sp. TaxID=2067992 RepID=UPI002DB9D778|nr:flagellar biosynthesis protein FlhF [Methylibium sp.]HEU4458215.1 flagellar biosynthesis protein FlhF [Methylibium sp.]